MSWKWFQNKKIEKNLNDFKVGSINVMLIRNWNDEDCVMALDLLFVL